MMLSSDISNVVAGQVSQMSMSAQYAQAMSHMHGFMHQGGTPIQDPRGISGGAAGGIGGAIGSSPFAALGAATMAAEFGFGPKLMAPFAMTMRAAQGGFAGGGVAGAVGAGAMTAGAYMGIGAGLGFMEDNIRTGAQTRGMLNQQIGGMLPGNGARQIGQMSSAVENMSRMGLGSINELTGLMQQGSQSGALETGSITKFQQSFSKLVSNVRQVATALNTTLNEAHSAMESVKGLGVSSSQSAGMASLMGVMGKASGLGPQQMYNAAAQGANMSYLTGSDIGEGVAGAVTHAGLNNMALRSGSFSGMTGATSGRFSSAAMRFFGSKQGRIALGAMMGEGGGLDEDFAAQMAGGALSGSDIRKRYRENMAISGSTDKFRSGQSALASAYVSKFGASSIGGMVDQMTSGSGRQETLKQAITGLTGNELDIMNQLQSAMPALRQKVINAAQEGFRSGAGGDPMQKLEQAFDQLLAPYKTRFQQMGATITQSVTEAIENMSTSLTGPSATPHDPSALRGAMGMMQLGNAQGLSAMQGALDKYGGGSQYGLARQGGGMASYLPSAMSMGQLGGDASFSDLPLGGLGSASYGGIGGPLGIYAGGTALGAAGRGVASAGMGMVRSFASGSARMAGGLGAMAGFAGRAVGFASKALGPAAAIASLAVGGGPQLLREMGLRGVDNGAIAGGSADTAHFLAEMNILRQGEDYGHVPVQGNSDTLFNQRQLVPVSGIQDGRQMGLSVDGMQKANAWLSEVQQAAGTLAIWTDSQKDKIISKVMAEGDTNKKVVQIVKDEMNLATPAEASKYAAALGLLGRVGTGVTTYSGMTPEQILESERAKINKAKQPEKGALSKVSEDDWNHMRYLVGANLDTPTARTGNKTLAQVAQASRAAKTGDWATQQRAAADMVGYWYGRETESPGANQGVSAGMLAGATRAIMEAGGGSFADVSLIDDARKTQVAWDRARSTMQGEAGITSYGMSAAAIGAGLSAREVTGLSDRLANAPSKAGAGVGEINRVGEDYVEMLMREEVSPAAAMGIAQEAGKIGTFAAGLQGGWSQNYARITSAANASSGRKAHELIKAVTGSSIRMDRDIKEYLSGKTDTLPAALDAQLTTNMTELMRHKYGSDATPTQVASGTATLLAGIRETMKGGGTKDAFERMVKQFSTMGLPDSPTAGKGDIGAVSAQAIVALGKFNEAVTGAAGVLKQMSGGER